MTSLDKNSKPSHSREKK